MANFIQRLTTGFFSTGEREEAIQAIGKDLRLKYRARNAGLGKRYHFLDELRGGPGEPRWRAYNILTGAYQGLYVKFFDCSKRGQHNDAEARFSCFLYQHKQFFPEVRIHRRKAAGIDQYLSTISSSVVEMEIGPTRFRSDFVVKSNEPEFARLVCTEPLMYYLVGTKEGACEIERNVVCLRFPRRVEPNEISTNLDRLVRLREYIPKDYIPSAVID